MKDYKLDIKIKNNLLYSAMIRNGIETVPELSKISGISKSELYRALSLKTTLYNSYNNIRPLFIMLSEVLKTLPEDLVPLQHHYIGLKKNTGSMEISFEELPMLTSEESMEDILQISYMKEAVHDVLNKLPERQKRIISMRFGLGVEVPMSYREISKIEGVTTERIRQIEQKGLRILKSPCHAIKLRDYYRETI